MAIRFDGFELGSRVTIGGITVNVWGQVSGGGTVWEQAASAGVTVAINPIRTDYELAPEPIVFEVDLSGFTTNTAATRTEYDPSYHDKLYFWDYGDGYDFTAPTQVIAMDDADGGDRKNSRYSLGPLGAHIFRTPGSHTVRLTVVEPLSGKWGQATASITVNDPDVFYGGSKTLFVEASGVYINAPTGAQTFTSLVDAMATINAETTPHRIVLERGQTHTIDERLFYRPPTVATGTSFRVEALDGLAARPIIQMSDIFTETSGGMFHDASLSRPTTATSGTVLKGLDIRGTWNVVTQTGNWRTDGITIDAVAATSSLVDDCLVSGVNTGVRHTNRDAIEANTDIPAVCDTAIGSWSNYGIFDPNYGYGIFAGVRVSQDIDAETGGPKDSAHNNHGPYRAGTPRATVMLACDFSSNTGWPSINTTYRGIQPGIRWNTGPNVTVGSGARLNMQHCAVESANVAIVLAAANQNSLSSGINAVIEGSMLVAGHQAGSVVGLTNGGATIRNNFLIHAETERDATSIGGQDFPPSAFVSGPGNTDGEGSTAENLTLPIVINNNTLVDLTQNGGVAEWGTGNLAFSAVTVANNWQVTDSTPDVNRVVAFTPRYKGYKDDNGVLHSAHALAADTVQIWTPTAGSSAIDASDTAEPTAAGQFKPSILTADVIPAAARDFGAVEAD